MDEAATEQQRYFVRRGEGQVRGPFTRERIDACVQAGQLLSTDEIRAESGEWMPVSVFLAETKARRPTGVSRVTKAAVGVLLAGLMVVVGYAEVPRSTLYPPSPSGGPMGGSQQPEREDPDVLFKRGKMYAEGEGVPQDDAEAVKWYRQAAEQGHAKAQFNLGLMYALGRGVPRDLVQAFAWCDIAAAAGLEPARVVRDSMKANMTPEQIV